MKVYLEYQRKSPTNVNWSNMFKGKSNQEIWDMIDDADIANSGKVRLRKKYLNGWKPPEQKFKTSTKYTRMFKGKTDEEIFDMIDSMNITNSQKRRLAKRFLNKDYYNQRPRKKKKWQSLFDGLSPQEINEIIDDLDMSDSAKCHLRKRYLRNGKTSNSTVYKPYISKKQNIKNLTGEQIDALLDALTEDTPPEKRMNLCKTVLSNVIDYRDINSEDKRIDFINDHPELMDLVEGSDD